MSRLHVDSVRKMFGERQLLSDIFLSCEVGEIVGLLGRNGSGKSVLLNIIFGSVSADNKFVKYDETPLKSIADSFGKIAYLPQNGFLPGHLKIKEAIHLFCRKESLNSLFDHELVKSHLYKKRKQLSGGEQKVIEILMMIHSDAGILLFDEPFSGLSPITIEVISQVIIDYKETKGFIITDHNYRNILRISDKIILLSNGKTHHIKDQTELIEKGYISSATFLD